MQVLIGFIIVPVVLAVTLWWLAGRERSRLGTARSLHIVALVLIVLGVGAFAESVRSVRDVARQANRTPSARVIDASVSWYSHVAVIDLIVSGAPAERDRILGNADDLPSRTRNAKTLNKTAHLTQIDGQARVPAPTPREFRAWAFLKIFTPIAALVVIGYSLILVNSARLGEPFGDRAIHATAQAGYFVLVALPLIVGLNSLLSEWVALEPGREWIGARPWSTTTALLVPWPGLGVLAFAAILKRGRELADTDRLTV